MSTETPLVWSEIPVADMARAKHFYQEVLGLYCREDPMPDCEYVSVSRTSSDSACLGLIKHPKMAPSLTASVVYLNLGDRLSITIGQLEAQGVQILLPPMAIKEGECGYCAQIADSEGNRLGLWAMQL
ncbi:VOC family protein [Shewanella chilikensis]|uniref:VOC family protein n=1 Tax=Shewanella chilikensis TaxID=558541 RepID=UPI003004A055